MDEIIEFKLNRVLNNPSNFEDGFTLRDEGIYVAATVLGIGMFDDAVIRLQEAGQEAQVGYFKINEINGKADLGMSDFTAMASDQIESIKFSFIYKDEAGAFQQKDFDDLKGLAELAKLESA